MLMWQTRLEAEGVFKLGFVPRLMQSHARPVFKCPLSIDGLVRMLEHVSLRILLKDSHRYSQYPIILCYSTMSLSFFIIILFSFFFSLSDWLERLLFSSHSTIQERHCQDSPRVVFKTLYDFLSSLCGSYCKFMIKLYFCILYLLFIMRGFFWEFSYCTCWLATFKFIQNK